jgi:hypothetical protein
MLACVVQTSNLRDSDLWRSAVQAREALRAGSGCLPCRRGKVKHSLIARYGGNIPRACFPLPRSAACCLLPHDAGTSLTRVSRCRDIPHVCVALPRHDPPRVLPAASECVLPVASTGAAENTRVEVRKKTQWLKNTEAQGTEFFRPPGDCFQPSNNPWDLNWRL